MLLLFVACSGGGSSRTQVDLFSGYGTDTLSVPVRLAIPAQTPAGVSTTISEFSVSPALPAGLSLDSTSGTISGTPSGLSPLRTYVVTAIDGNAFDEKPIQIEVRAPQVGLSSNRPLARSVLATGTPAALSGTPIGLTGSAPSMVVSPPTEFDTPAMVDSSPMANISAQVNSTDPLPPLHDATVDFVADLTIDDTELSPEAWAFAAQAPYDDDALMPDLSGFSFDTSSAALEDGQLRLDVSLPGTPVGTFPSAAVPTRLHVVEPVTEVLDDIDTEWVSLAGSFFTSVLNGTGHREIYRFDPDGGLGGAPLMEAAFDLDPAADGSARIIAVAAGRLIVGMDEAPDTGKIYAYEPNADELVQIADLAPGVDDVIDRPVELGGDLYFSGRLASGLELLFRYTFATETAPAMLQAVSSTSEGSSGNDDPESLTPLGGLLYFTALNSAGSRSLYRYNPVTSTQERLSMSANEPIGDLMEVGGILYAEASTSMGAEKLFRWDGTAGALVQLSDLQDDPAQTDGISLLLGSQDALYFGADDSNGDEKLHRYTPGGSIEQVSDTAGAGNSDTIGEIIAMDNEVLFVASNTDGGSKVFSLDLDSGVTRQVIDINGPTLDDDPCQLTAIGDGRAALELSDNSTGYKLYIYDPSLGVMYQAADINEMGGDETYVLGADGTRVFFRSEDSDGDLRVFVIE